MIEQKLFFTRNGQYTIWEKINSLKNEELDMVIDTVNNVECTSLSDESYKKKYIYTLYNKDEDMKEKLEKEINNYFVSDRIDKCDFNASLYKINLNYTDINLAYTQLQKLKFSNIECDEQNIRTEIFFYKEENLIDIRISSLKINAYKDNTNEQILNTEVRIYFQFGLLLMTEYCDYTHSKKTKNIFLDKIYSLLNDDCGNKETYKLSDITLRLLLKKSKKYASKFKFYIDEFLNVDFNVMEDIGANPLEHSGLKEFYDKHKISLVKICMSSNTEKYITVDGEKGKLISRSKSIEIRDINEFINLINEIIIYDYLNFDYKKNIKDAAKRKMKGHTAAKISYVNSLYENVTKKISEYLDEKNDIDIVEFTRNTFFYCLIHKKMVINKEELKYVLDNEVINRLSKWLEIDRADIEYTFNFLIKIAIKNSENLLEAFDNWINDVGELNVNQV